LIEDIDKAVVKINVFYESTTYITTTETEAMTAIVLFSNIGGTLSFCLGLSILSLIKVVGILLSISIKNKAKYKVNQW
jgi:ABC-type Mn2+/Zn2+ transport system permease subunit